MNNDNPKTCGNQWQLCPKCHGQGVIGYPPNQPLAVEHYTASQTTWQCDVCNGAKILATPCWKPKEDK
jgi:hypothetical protein